MVQKVFFFAHFVLFFWNISQQQQSCSFKWQSPFCNKELEQHMSADRSVQVKPVEPSDSKPFSEWQADGEITIQGLPVSHEPLHIVKHNILFKVLLSAYTEFVLIGLRFFLKGAKLWSGWVKTHFYLS